MVSTAIRLGQSTIAEGNPGVEPDGYALMADHQGTTGTKVRGEQSAEGCASPQWVYPNHVQLNMVGIPTAVRVSHGEAERAGRPARRPDIFMGLGQG